VGRKEEEEEENGTNFKNQTIVGSK
jgi:hypothetical protein